MKPMSARCCWRPTLSGDASIAAARQKNLQIRESCDSLVNSLAGHSGLLRSFTCAWVTTQVDSNIGESGPSAPGLPEMALLCVESQKCGSMQPDKPSSAQVSGVNFLHFIFSILDVATARGS